jgi:hypothetical protein
MLHLCVNKERLPSSWTHLLDFSHDLLLSRASLFRAQLAQLSPSVMLTYCVFSTSCRQWLSSLPIEELVTSKMHKSWTVTP